MNEKIALLNKSKQLKSYYKKLFDENRSNIDNLEKFNNKKSLIYFTKKNPEFILGYIGTFGFSLIFAYILIRLDKQEFNDQLKIWKSINNY